MKDYAGQFEHPAYQTLTISQEGEQLKFDLHGLTGALKHYHYDIFQGAEGPAGLEGTKLTFLVSRAGEIDSVAIALEPNVKEHLHTQTKTAREGVRAKLSFAHHDRTEPRETKNDKRALRSHCT